MSLWLNPENVTFAGAELGGVVYLRLERKREKLIVERGDSGPQALFVDCVGCDAEFVLRRVPGEWETPPLPGTKGEITFEVARGSSRAGRVLVSADVVLVSAATELSGRKGAVQEMRFLAVSADGVSDPVRVEGLS